MAETDFAGKIALITGGGSGIGRATAVHLAQRGAHVTITGRRAKALDETLALITAAGGTGDAVAMDVCDPAAMERLHGDLLDRHGRLDIAFNNAGFQEARGPLHTQPDAVYAQVFDTNVRAVLDGLRHQIPAMIAQGGGAIVVNASVSGLRNPNPGFGLYSASKAAVISMTRAAAMEVAQDGVRINAVAPGRVVTDMMLNSKVMDMRAVAAGLPLRRMGTPEEVAAAVAWLASDAAAFVVGHVLCVDGGFMAG
ncbi:MAG: glucose 1-dehydrogenase [Pseudomonadota bacterium]